ncbi:MAG: glycosyltransferase, partial [Bacteroidota bacterium]
YSGIPYYSVFNRAFNNEVKSFNIMLLARVYRGKGHDLFLRLASDFPQHKFFIIGQSENPDYYKELYDSATSNVQFVGGGDIYALVRDLEMQISITPSIVEESFGLVPIESMAMSCLSIVSDRGNLPNISKKTGAWLFSTYDELKNMILKIEGMTYAELDMISKSQYYATMSHYDYQHAKILFANNLL